MRLLGLFFFFFFHNTISQLQNRLQRTKSKKYAQKTSKIKKVTYSLICVFILLVLLVKTKSLSGLKKLVFMSLRQFTFLPVPLN